MFIDDDEQARMRLCDDIAESVINAVGIRDFWSGWVIKSTPNKKRISRSGEQRHASPSTVDFLFKQPDKTATSTVVSLGRKIRNKNIITWYKNGNISWDNRKVFQQSLTMEKHHSAWQSIFILPQLTYPASNVRCFVGFVPEIIYRCTFKHGKPRENISWESGANYLHQIP